MRKSSSKSQRKTRSGKAKKGDNQEEEKTGAGRTGSKEGVEQRTSNKKGKEESQPKETAPLAKPDSKKKLNAPKQQSAANVQSPVNLLNKLDNVQEPDLEQVMRN